MMTSKRHYPMKSDVREKDDKYILDIDLPGFQKEDIQAAYKHGVLKLQIPKQPEPKDDTEGRISIA